MGTPGRADDRRWSQPHLSHYAEGDPRRRRGPSTPQAAENTGIGQAASTSRRHRARPRVPAAIGGQALVTAGR